MIPGVKVRTLKYNVLVLVLYFEKYVQRMIPPCTIRRKISKKLSTYNYICVRFHGIFDFKSTYLYDTLKSTYDTYFSS